MLKETIKEMDEFVLDNRIVRTTDLMVYAKENKPEWVALLESPAFKERMEYVIEINKKLFGEKNENTL